MKKKATALNKILDKKRDEFITEFNSITERMQPYDVSAFTSELESAFSYYSLRHFDEEKFQKMILNNFDLDLSNPIVKELTIDNIYYYSHAFISLEALRNYVRSNNIQTETDNEGMVYNS